MDFSILVDGLSQFGSILGTPLLIYVIRLEKRLTSIQNAISTIKGICPGFNMGQCPQSKIHQWPKLSAIQGGFNGKEENQEA